MKFFLVGGGGFFFLHNPSHPQSEKNGIDAVATTSVEGADEEEVNASLQVENS